MHALAASLAVLVSSLALAGGETITVTTLHDVRDFGGAHRIADLPGPDGKISMGEACDAANNEPGPQTIEFAIPRGEYWLVQEIALLELDIGPFVLIDDGTTIDFRTQTAFAGDTNPTGWEVGIYGLQPNGWGGAAIYVQGNHCTIIGLDDVYQRGYGVEVNGDDNRVISCTTDGPLYYAINVEGLFTLTIAERNVVGGVEPGEGNVVSGGNGGIAITAPADDNIVIGNTCLGSPYHGIAVVAASRYDAFARRNRIGGPTEAERNWAAGNGTSGEEGFPVGDQIMVLDADDTVVENNFVGTTQDGMADYPVQRGPAGIAISSARDTLVRGNLVSGMLQVGGGHYQGQRFGTGIVVGATSADTRLVGNLIGVDALGQNPIPNVIGVLVEPATARDLPLRTTIGSPDEPNTIANSERFGVGIHSLVNGVLLSANHIHDNSGVGIDLAPYAGYDGVTPNDPLDVDTNGANLLQNFPVLSSATAQASGTRVVGTLNSRPNRAYRLEFFANAACDPTGHGEGQAYMGAIDVTTDAAGNADFEALFPGEPGGWITATATDAGLGYTSEFSACAEVQSPPCLADFNLDGQLNIFDFLAFQAAFGGDDPAADVDANGVLNIFDFLAFQTAFGNGC